MDFKFDFKDPDLMNELKAMGWSDDEENMDIDPELAEMEKEIEKEDNYDPSMHQGKQLTAEEIENMKFDEDDLDDPNLLAELEEAEDRSEDPVLKMTNRCEELKQQIEVAKQTAIKYKQSGNKDKALEYIKAMKSLQVELESSENMLNVHQIAQRKKEKGNKAGNSKPKEPAFLPDSFDFTTIVSMSVLEYEKERALARKKKDIVDTIDMQIDIITNNINFGILTQEAYIESIESKIKEYDEIVKKGQDNGAYEKHLELMRKELEEANNMEEEEEEEEQQEEEEVKAPPPKSSTVNIPNPLQSSPAPVAPPPKPIEPQAPQVQADIHERLMQNIKYKSVYESFEEGKEAFNYLKGTGKSELCEKLMNKLEIWQKIVKQYERGNEVKSEIKPLCPTDITGVTEEERRKQFRTLIEFSTSQAAKCKEQALAALKSKDKELAAQYKREMLVNENKSKLLEEGMKNPWQPPPEIAVRSFVKSVPQTNDDLEPGVLEIAYGKATGLSDKENYLITYSLVAGETLAGATDKFTKVCERGFNHTFTLKLESRNFASLFKKHIIFEVFEYHMIRSNKSQGNCNIKLEPLAKQCVFKTSIQLSRKGPSIEVTFRIHKSLSVPEMKQVVEKIEYVEDLCAPFKSIDGIMLSKTSAKTNVVEERKEEKKQEANFDDVAEDEYDNPNVIRNLLSFEVLEYEIERLKSVIIDLRSNGKNADNIMNFQRELMKNKSIIEAQVGNGMISPEQYKQVLENQVAHDMKLAEFYKAKGKKEHFGVVANRIKIMKKELEELNNS
ncbi:hypothetical protein SteCoe_35379 [Stentor coeruleus]|uniref:C2 domain-containing protein n=1 Tax=Stentor coeruleus TaxID=5963 RepID=A0A1R2ASE0_9CILI|nr:hypothetical protein SteCoe_35379 [Stentor coeruleus]